MPTKSRIDAPGTLHHIIFRSIERCRIFKDDSDWDNLLRRLGGIIEQTDTRRMAIN
jgi:putative transposase